MKQIMLLTSLLFAVFCGVQAQETYYEKHLIFPEKATAAQKLDMASRLIPTATVGVAANGVYRFPAFRYQYLYGT